MEQKYYTVEKNKQILISLLKQYNIKKVVASPGTTNVTFVGSLQHDPFFEMYSCVDERSAAYMACGLAEESGEPVVLTCTGATASRNYVPGLTEAYYRKLPILAVTATQNENRIGHLVPQVIDRSMQMKDMCVCSEHVRHCESEEDVWEATIRVNRCLQALARRGGGPVHLNLETRYSRDFSVKELPMAKKIGHYSYGDSLPALPHGRIAIFVGSHSVWTQELTDAVDRFCSAHNAVVFCDHSSNYKGRFRVCNSLVGSQSNYISPTFKNDLLIHIGEVSGDYSASRLNNTYALWRVNPDGEIRDYFRKIKVVFEMSELAFFSHYASGSDEIKDSNEYLRACQDEYDKLHAAMPEVPFSNIWIAQHTANSLPANSYLHLGILNTLRAWNMFEIPTSVLSFVNVGGFGIDGCLSSCIGASLAHPDRLHFIVLGDLSFFYDMNVMGNHHVGSNVRILLVNNGVGTEFKNYNHPAHEFGAEANKFMAAGGHFGNKSKELVKHYAQNLGFEYLSASTKEEYLTNQGRFLSAEMAERPMLFEIFTTDEDESDALYAVYHILEDMKSQVVSKAREILPKPVLNGIKKMIRR